MKVRLGLLRLYLREGLYRASMAAPTDDDATVPGHLPNELPKSAAIDEDSWVPGRWYPSEGEPLDGDEASRLGEPIGETDDRMEGDGLGPGAEDESLKLADHLRTGQEKTSLGSPPDETMGDADEKVGVNMDESRWLNRAIRRFMLQEYPAGAGMSDPTRDPKGAYTDFDMTRDHMGTDDLSATWYRSPGREAGTEGDSFRGEDPNAQLGFHPPAGPADPTTAPPGSEGEEGVAARHTPGIWQLSGGGDTSKMLGANAKDPSGGVDSGDESEEGEEGQDGDGQGVVSDEAERS